MSFRRSLRLIGQAAIGFREANLVGNLECLAMAPDLEAQICQPVRKALWRLLKEQLRGNWSREEIRVAFEVIANDPRCRQFCPIEATLFIIDGMKGTSELNANSIRRLSSLPWDELIEALPPEESIVIHSQRESLESIVHELNDGFINLSDLQAETSELLANLAVELRHAVSKCIA